MSKNSIFITFYQSGALFGAPNLETAIFGPLERQKTSKKGSGEGSGGGKSGGKSGKTSKIDILLIFGRFSRSINYFWEPQNPKKRQKT
jgi:hypothetical protein